MLRSALLATLLVVALPAAAGADPAPAVPGPAAVDDAALLTLDAPRSSGFATHSLDVSAAVALQRDSLAARLDRRVLADAFRNASSVQRRREVLLEAATSVEIRISTVAADARTLRSAYLNGSIDAPAYVRRLAYLDARADLLAARLDRIQGLADRVPRVSLRIRLRNIGTGLVGFQGPVRDRTVAALRGEAPPARVAVTASRNGSVLSMVDGDTYVRTAHRVDQRAQAAGGIGFDQAVTRAGELYPVAFNAESNVTRGVDSVGAGIYRITIDRRQGTIVAYIDGSTRNVFYEIQRQRLNLLRNPGIATADNGLRLVVNRTFPGGPLRVAVSDEATGAPLPAVVIVDGVRFETGEDGVLWAVAPRGNVDVTAVGPEGNVSLSARPTTIRPVNNTAPPGDEG